MKLQQKKRNPFRGKKIKKENRQKLQTLANIIQDRLPAEKILFLQECLLKDRAGAPRIAELLQDSFSPYDFQGGNDSKAHFVWDVIGKIYKNSGRTYEALTIFLSEYSEMIKTQFKINERIHKGTPLCWLFDVFLQLGYRAIAKRYIMLTLCEDAITSEGHINVNTTGAYFRLVWQMGMSHSEFRRYEAEIWKIAQENPIEIRFPEWILQRLDDKWMTENPASAETGIYFANAYYVDYLISQLGEGTGVVLERLAEYILQCIPGCRASSRQRSESTDYDVVCCFEGVYGDFRSCVDRYFVCECKDWAGPANTTTILKLSRVLKSIKAKFGILFSKKGISGEAQFSYAEREIIKFFSEEGIVVVVITFDDLSYVANGGNLIALLRSKYEKIRLDLAA